MYTYEEPSLFSGKRGLALLAVLLLHGLIGYGLYAGLASRIMHTIIPPVQIAQIDQPKKNDKPPPPPPKLQDIKPYVPPPEFVDIQAPTQQTNAITEVTRRIAPAPVARPAPRAVVRTGISYDMRHLVNPNDYYPDASRRAGEEGTCRVRITVGINGRVTAAAIAVSTGHPRLDEACLKVARAYRFHPATVGGKPIESSSILPIVFKITNEDE
ncbi:MAG TPA: energy transducer TonB [Steroidobacteraceae bacterium]|nr:energy transducer TonB [Steroidobacteraceae bacterium]